MPWDGYDDGLRSAQPVPQPRSTASMLLLGCMAVALVLCVLCGVGGALGWPSLVKFGIQEDLAKYRTAVRSSHLDPKVESELVGRIERIRDAAHERDVRFMSWVEHDEAMKSLLADDTLHEKDVPAFESELGRLEKELGVAPVGSAR